MEGKTAGRLAEKPEILFVTGNGHKFREAESILKHFGVNISHKNLHLEEMRSDSVEEIARASALDAYAKAGVPLFVEDSGLFIPSLGGFPGAYSAWAFGKIGNAGILKLAAGSVAEFRAAIAYADENGAKTFTGIVKGRISDEIRGNEGFGYDPIFIPDKFAGVRHSGEKTFAEVPEMKAALSHRKRALEEFGKYIKQR
ncbi:RdgB/HAM1 family non-canonical purine NTP pyrophosphatase [Candidatus Micrarchaeota archaeon]|nr:RdgB/HAM1 family non-canonical purine NTP pyrophosphatase [Candidatus Micrarchaeota archaeon]